jgi:RNA polymerase sigma-70 factor (ECF subfamily)
MFHGRSIRPPDGPPRKRTFSPSVVTYLQTTARTDDASLVADAIEGDAQAFTAIVGRYKDAVFGIALARVRNFHDAQDLTQATFMEALTGLPRLRDPTRLGAWLRTIAVHRSLNLATRRREGIDLEAIDEPAAPGPTPADDVEGQQLRAGVLRAIGTLRKAQRETVTLFYIGDYSLAEVAAIQDVPVGTVKRRLHDARLRLKQEMLEMVEEVLRDNVPDEALADRVFAAVAAWPPGELPSRKETHDVVAKIGAAGREGFERAYALPHAPSRLRAVQHVAHYWGTRYEEDGPPQQFMLELLIKALDDPNRRVRRAAADRLLFAGRVMERADWVEQVLPHLIGLMTHACKHTRKMAIGKVHIWVRFYGTPSSAVREAVSLEEVCRAMAQETETEVLWRFRHLIAHLVEAQSEDCAW